MTCFNCGSWTLHWLSCALRLNAPSSLAERGSWEFRVTRPCGFYGLSYHTYASFTFFPLSHFALEWLVYSHFSRPLYAHRLCLWIYECLTISRKKANNAVNYLKALSAWGQTCRSLLLSFTCFLPTAENWEKTSRPNLAPRQTESHHSNSTNTLLNPLLWVKEYSCER